MTTSSAIDEFRFSLPLDSGLLVADIAAGKPVDQTEILSLAAMAQSAFTLVTLTSRGLDRVRDQYSLWTEAAQLFGELVGSGASIESGDPQVQSLRTRISHYHELALDRVSLYSISESARSKFVERKAFGSENGYSSPTESEPAREFSSLETARITSACKRLGV